MTRPADSRQPRPYDDDVDVLHTRLNYFTFCNFLRSSLFSAAAVFVKAARNDVNILRNSVRCSATYLSPPVLFAVVMTSSVRASLRFRRASATCAPLGCNVRYLISSEMTKKLQTSSPSQ